MSLGFSLYTCVHERSVTRVQGWGWFRIIIIRQLIPFNREFKNIWTFIFILLWHFKRFNGLKKPVIWRESSNKGLLSYLIQILKISFWLFPPLQLHTHLHLHADSAYLFSPDFYRKVWECFSKSLEICTVWKTHEFCFCMQIDIVS